MWTGSCPCQPFSAAGKGGGVANERYLWPDFFRLISECRPAIVFGEQVASAAGLGRLDLVQAALEGAGYACGAADLCAASLGAPHIRQRLYWVAHTDQQLRNGRGYAGPGRRAQSAERGGLGWVADADDPEWGQDGAGGNDSDGQAAGWEQSTGVPGHGSATGGLGDTARRRRGERRDASWACRT